MTAPRRFGRGSEAKPAPRALFATDLDGTLLAADGTVHPQDAEAIAALGAAGVPVTIATGRMHSGCAHIAEQLGLESPLVCLDGSQLVYTNGEHLNEEHIAPEALAVLHSALSETRPKTFVFADNQVVHDAEGEALLPYVGIWSRATHSVPRVLDHGAAFVEGNMLGLVAVGVEAQIAATQAALEHITERHVNVISFPSRRVGFEDTWALVVRRAGISKASGLEAVAAHHGLTLEDVVAVGDWLNDLPMLQAVGRSYAMAQAPEVVREAAGESLTASEATGGGIAEAARRAGLL